MLYVTERCVFRLTPEGLELIEIAPGVDLERDILAKMGFKPIMKGEPRRMDVRIFNPAPMGLRDLLLAVPLAQRLSYDAEANILFVNFGRFRALPGRSSYLRFITSDLFDTCRMSIIY